jgi:hypothetical protein
MLSFLIKQGLVILDSLLKGLFRNCYNFLFGSRAWVMCTFFGAWISLSEKVAWPGAFFRFLLSLSLSLILNDRSSINFGGNYCFKPPRLSS